MPLVRFLKKAVQVPDTWEAWAMRVLTMGIVVVLFAAWALMGRIAELQSQITSGRNERNAYQVEQTERVCALLRSVERDPKVVEGAKC